MSHLNQLQFFVSSSTAVRAEITIRLRELGALDGQIHTELSTLRQNVKKYRNTSNYSHMFTRDENSRKRKRSFLEDDTDVSAPKSAVSALLVSWMHENGSAGDGNGNGSTMEAPHVNYTTGSGEDRYQSEQEQATDAMDLEEARSRRLLQLEGSIRSGRTRVRRLCDERAAVAKTLKECCIELDSLLKGRLAHFRQVLTSTGELQYNYRNGLLFDRAIHPEPLPSGIHGVIPVRVF